MKRVSMMMFVVCIFAYGSIEAKSVVKRKMPDKLVVLTFDDAVSSLYNNVMPMLEKYRFSASFYICEFQPNFSDTTKYMTWEKIGNLGKKGYDIGNHTKNHVLMEKVTKEKIVEELEYIDDKCIAAGLPKPSTFAYPAYANDSNSVATLDSLGYTFARTGGDRLYDPLVDHPLQVPSFTVSMDNGEKLYKYINRAQRGKVAVLTLHGVPDYDHAWVTFSVEKFQQMLDYLHEQGCTVISLKDLNRYIDVEQAKKSIVPSF